MARPRENVDVVRRIWELWATDASTGDPEAVSAPFDEGLIAADSTFTPVQDFPGAGHTYRGIAGLREFLESWSAEWADWRIVLEEAVDAGDDRVVAVIHLSGVGRSSRAPVEVRCGAVFELRGGQVVDRRDHPDPAAAFEAAGLPPP